MPSLADLMRADAAVQAAQTAAPMSLADQMRADAAAASAPAVQQNTAQPAKPATTTDKGLFQRTVDVMNAGLPGVGLGDYYPAFLHHAGNLVHGGAQLVGHGAQAAANYMAPESEAAKYIRDAVAKDDAALSARKNAYLAATSNVKTPGSYAGAVYGEVAPMVFGGLPSAVRSVGDAVASPISRLAASVSSPAAKKTAELLAKSVSGATQGAAIAGVTPVTSGDYWQEKADQAKTGAILGGAMPVVGSTLGTIYDKAKAIVDPLVNHDSVIAKTLARAIGQDNIDSVVNSLGKSPSTPGVQFSAAQRTGNSSLAAFEDAIKAANPGGDLGLQSAKNNTALASALRNLAKDDAAIAAANQARQQASNPLYTAARNSSATVDLNRTINLIDGIVGKNPANKALVEPLKQIRESLFNQDNALMQKPNEVMSAIDNIKAMMGNKDNAYVLGQLDTIKKSLTHQLSKAAPEFSQAEQTYAAMSRPINQMQVGQLLSNKLIPATAGDAPARLNASSLATALRNPNQVAKLATGFKRARMESVLDPEQLNLVQGVNSDASRIAEMAALGNGAGSATARRQSINGFIGENMANEFPFASKVIGALGNVPGINIPLHGVGAAANMVGGKINQTIAAKLENILANDPEKLAQLLRSGNQAQQTQLVQQLLGGAANPMIRSMLSNSSAPASVQNP